MASTFFFLTTSDQIRGQLGVDSTEFSDTDITNLDIEKELELDLLLWFPNFIAISNDTGVSPSDEYAQKIALQTYAKLFCAYHSLTMAPLKFIKSDGDGPNSSSRILDNKALNTFKQELMIKFGNMKSRVLSYSTAYTPVKVIATASYLGMKVSIPTKNIITG